MVPREYQLAGPFGVVQGQPPRLFDDDLGHIFIGFVVAHAGLHVGIPFAEKGEFAALVIVLEQLGAVGLAVPVGVAFHVGEVVPIRQDLGHYIVVLLLVCSREAPVSGEDALVVGIATPRSTPDELGNPNGTFVDVIVPFECVVQIPLVPIAVHVEDVATPAASVDGVHELAEPAEAAVVRGRGAEAHARGHQVFPVVQDGLHVLRMVVRAVARLVVGLHVAGLGHAAAGGHGRPVLVDVVGHPFGIRQVAAVALPPVVAPRDVEGVHNQSPAIAGDTFLLVVIPLEHAVGGNLPVHLLGKFSKLEVFLVGDEAAAVAASARAVGESHHVAPFELEAPDAVVELGGGEGVHVAAGMLRAEVVDRLAAEVRFGIDGQGLEVLAVGHDDGAGGIHLHLAVLAVHGILSVDLDEAQVAEGVAGADVLEDDDGMFRVGQVDAAGRGEGRLSRDGVVHVLRQGDGIGHLRHLFNRIGSPCGRAERGGHGKGQ